MNILNYIDKYKDLSFFEEEFNEIDNLVFSALVYIDFKNIIPSLRKGITLFDAGSLFLAAYDKSVIKYTDPVKLDNIKLLREIYKSNRYGSIKLYNYLNITNEDMQFCAVTIDIGTNIVVAFEGTDETIVGWKEDFQMAYKFPVDAQIYAMNYLNKTIRIFDKNVIVLGHSKGGNLALVSSMYSKFMIRHKIKKIYNNDGPGLRKAEFESKEFLRISDKYIHILPNYSYIGVLLRNKEENDYVINSLKKGVYTHHLFNWEVNDKYLVRTNLSKFSINLKQSNVIWLDDHTDDMRKKMIDEIFKVLKQSNVKTTYDFKNIKVATSVIKNMTKIDEETKNLALDFLKFNINYQVENRK